MNKLLFASQNKGKLQEVRSILAPLELEVVSPSELGQLNSKWSSLADVDVKETGSTLKENALIKAQFFAESTKLLTVADDSGLLVKALDDFPGVASNRWLAGSDHDRNVALLKKLKEIEDREAAFVTVLCLIDPNQDDEKFFEGRVKGEIGFQPQGEEGFGYDPIFIPEGFKTSFAELGIDVKNQLSHRQQALVKLSQYLKETP